MPYKGIYDKLLYEDLKVGNYDSVKQMVHTILDNNIPTYETIWQSLIKNNADLGFSLNDIIVLFERGLKSCPQNDNSQLAVYVSLIDILSKKSDNLKLWKEKIGEWKPWSNQSKRLEFDKIISSIKKNNSPSQFESFSNKKSSQKATIK